MNKKLPNIFKGIVFKNNNQDVSFINKEEENEVDVKKQIKNILNSSEFVYKADTIITLNTGEVLEKTIIGRNNNSLITIDDELIEVNSISRIELV